MTRAIKLEAEKWYTLQDIVRGKMLPWVSSFRSVRNVVEMDGTGKNVLKPTITGEGRGKKYYFKGSNIIKFLSKIEAGEIRL